MSLMTRNQIKQSVFFQNWFISMSLFLLFFTPFGVDAFNERHLKTISDAGHCKRCDLRGAFLAGSVIVEGDLSRARLQGADLQGVYFQGVKLYKADLTSADLSGAYLVESDFSKTKLVNARL